MKYVILAIVCAFGGFVASWWMFKAITLDDSSAPGQPLVTTQSPRIPVSSPANTGNQPVTFEDIRKSRNVFDQIYMAWQLAASSNEPQIIDLIRKCLDDNDPLYNDSLVSVFLERYTELDPRGAIDFVTHEQRLDQAVYQGNVITSWLRYDPKAAVDYFLGITNQLIKARVGARLLADPALADAGLTDQVRDALGPEADRIMKLVAQQRLDPADQYRQALLLSGQDRRSQLIQAVSRWASRDPVDALSQIVNLSDPDERKLLVSIAVNRYADQNPEAALNWIQANRPGDTRLQQAVLVQLARQDINKALPLAEDFVRRTGQTGALGGIVSIWARRNPDQAISYVDGLNIQDKSSLYRTIAFTYMQNHPVSALNWVVSLGSQYTSLKTSVLSQIGSENESAAETALGNSSDPATRSALISGIANYKSATDPKAALDWLNNYSGDKGYLSAYSNVLSSYARQDPAQAAQLLDTSLSGPRISYVAGRIAGDWYDRDPDAATNWATSLPPSDARNGATLQLAMSISRKDPERALSLTTNLPDTQRQQAVREIGYSWVSRHPEQVEAIISKLNTTPDVANQLRQLARMRH